MSSKYKVADSTIPHFVTFSVVGWIDVFSREQYKEIMVKRLQYCVEHKGLTLHALLAQVFRLSGSLDANKICPDCIGNLENKNCYLV